MSRMIRTLLFSTLFPSVKRPIHGIFVETRLQELLKSGEVETKVVAPVPWFPFAGDLFGDYGVFAETPYVEIRDEVEVFHPRYFLLPKIGMNIAPYTLAKGALPVIKKIIEDGFDFDLIDAHYYYPDGVAAALLAKWLNKPFVITARGTDVNLISRYSVPKKMMCWAAGRAGASITVSNALSNVLVDIGVKRSELLVLRNGVDVERFNMIPQSIARQELGWPNEVTLLSVGNLVKNKGHHIAIELIAMKPDLRLVIVGDGPERGSLDQLVRNLGVSNRVIFAGRIAQAFLPAYYSAADILILASSREGWPNVLLEAMACGTPVVASNVGGVPEVVSAAEAGRLVDQRDATHFANGVDSLLRAYPERMSVRAYAEGFGWKATTEGQLALFRRILDSDFSGSLAKPYI